MTFGKSLKAGQEKRRACKGRTDTACLPVEEGRRDRRDNSPKTWREYKHSLRMAGPDAPRRPRRRIRQGQARPPQKDRDPKLHGRVSGAVDGQPEGCGIKSNVRTGRLILIMLSEVFGISGISPSTAYRTMRRIGKSYKKPGRPLDQRALSGEAKEKFKIDLGRKIADCSGGGVLASSGLTSHTSQPRPFAE